jgi:spermidine synthase
VNTVGAAAGAFLTDSCSSRKYVSSFTQLVAVALNLVAAGGALWVARRSSAAPGPKIRTRPTQQIEARAMPHVMAEAPESAFGAVRWAAVALALSGFAALGIEMLWLRRLAVLLGGFRAVFSLLLTVMLLAMATGALVGGWLRT